MCMRYINPNSRRGIVNKLADYILNQIDNSQTTRLQFTDFKTFYVVNGNTNSDKVLDLSIIKESFYNENKERNKLGQEVHQIFWGEWEEDNNIKLGWMIGKRRNNTRITKIRDNNNKKNRRRILNVFLEWESNEKDYLIL